MLKTNYLWVLDSFTFNKKLEWTDIFKELKKNNQKAEVSTELQF